MQWMEEGSAAHGWPQQNETGEAMSHDYAVVDVFADHPLTGNPLAVVTGADDLDEETMAAIAVEFNLSETTFVTNPTLPGADWRLRSFTPTGDEVVGAGHNALGAWWWLVASGRVAPPGAVQELGGRALPVHVDVTDGVITIGLDQGPVTLDQATVRVPHLAAALAAHTLDAAAIGHVVCGSVGSRHLLVPVGSTDEVDAVRPDGERLRGLLAAAGAQGCYVYTTATADLSPQADAYARFFNPTVGIAEDPATGSAAGPLAAHLAAGRTVDLTILQGVRMGRPSSLRVSVRPDGTTLNGTCALSATGHLTI
jgi:PhzF family phenazine biosynthesis protein